MMHMYSQLQITAERESAQNDVDMQEGADKSEALSARNESARKRLRRFRRLGSLTKRL